MEAFKGPKRETRSTSSDGSRSSQSSKSGLSHRFPFKTFREKTTWSRGEDTDCPWPRDPKRRSGYNSTDNLEFHTVNGSTRSDSTTSASNINDFQEREDRPVRFEE
jgi:hypothetical protein